MAELFNYGICFTLGWSTGVIELSSRYRDSLTVLIRWPGLIYALINGLIAVIALYFLLTFKVPFSTDTAQAAVLRVFAASFGGMAVLRSSLFDARFGDETIGVGPHAALQLLLKTIDRQVDRLRASERVRAAVEITEGLSFDKTFESLPMVVAAGMQNLEKEDADKFTDAVAKLKSTTVSERFRLILLALITMNVVGDEVLRNTVKKMESQLKPDPPSPPK